MTSEQQHKAAIALLNHQLNRLQRITALERHNRACKWVTKYNLPYRVSMDYMKRYNSNSGIVLINECYPLPGYRIADLITVSIDELDHDNEALYTMDFNGNRYYHDLSVFQTPKKDIAEKITLHNHQLQPWNMETAAGIEAWEHEFAHFLSGYDIDRFTAFDMFGKGNVSDDVLEGRKHALTAVQHRFYANIDSYRTDEPIYLEEYNGIYTTRKFLLKW